MLSSMESLLLHRFLSLYQTIPLPMSRYIKPLYATIKALPVASAEALLSAYYRYCNLSPCTVDLDDGQTSMHIWAPNHRRFTKPNLVLVHGYGGNSKWQFVLQIAQLAREFNVYMPDLVFFGKSWSSRAERTDRFQAKCVCDGLRKLGVEKCAVYGISYGGFVVYRMAEMEEKMVERLMIVSSAIVFTEEQRTEQLKKFGRNVVDMLVPEKIDDIRTLCRMSMYKIDVSRWFPDFFLRGFIGIDGCKKEKRGLVEDLLSRNPDLHRPLLNQETLIIWGDKDNIFPVELAHQLQRHLGPKSKVKVIKDAGHATNIEAPGTLNQLIMSFVSRVDH